MRFVFLCFATKCSPVPFFPRPTIPLYRPIAINPLACAMLISWEKSLFMLEIWSETERPYTDDKLCCVVGVALFSFTWPGLPFFALKSVHADSLVTLTKDSDNSSVPRLRADKKSGSILQYM